MGEGENGMERGGEGIDGCVVATAMELETKR